MSNLFLIRHGQASFGQKNYDRLSLTGLKQSRILAEYLHKIHLGFDAIYCGTMERQVKTAKEYSSYCDETSHPAPEIFFDSRLNEFDAEGVMKTLLPVLVKEKPDIRIDSDTLMKDRASFQRVFEIIMRMWSSGKYDMKGVSTWNDFNDGVNGCIEEIMQKHDGGKNIAVFTSGGPISVLVKKVLSLSIEKTMEIRDLLVNTSITRFRYSQNRIMLSSFNEYPHLELENDRNIITYR